MKIEKGKLYYNTALGKLEKAEHSYEIKDGLLTDKIAVHCPTKADCRFVNNVLGHDVMYRDDVVIFIDILRWSNYDTRHIKELNYHIITIEEFKEFYPPDVEQNPYVWGDKIVISNKKEVLDSVKDKVFFQDKIDYAKKSLENSDLSFISSKKDEIVQNVIQKYQQRSDVGIQKYGTTLQENNDGIEIFLTHLQEELMDATLYIEKLKNKFAQLKKEL